MVQRTLTPSRLSVLIALGERELKSHTSAFHFHMGLHSSYRTAG